MQTKSGLIVFRLDDYLVVKFVLKITKNKQTARFHSVIDVLFLVYWFRIDYYFVDNGLNNNNNNNITSCLPTSGNDHNNIELHNIIIILHDGCIIIIIKLSSPSEL